LDPLVGIGIGRATSIALNTAGWSVVVIARRDKEIQETIELCPNRHETAAWVGDITSEDSMEGAFKHAVERFGRVDLLFNNAGISSKPDPLEDLALSTFQNVINVNLVGTFICTKQAFKVFKSQTPPGGRIINNGSMSAYTPRPNAMPYTASKHAITGMTKSTHLDGRAFNIACTQIDIGNASTDMVSGQIAGTLQANGQIAKEAVFDVKHVADSIVHIANLPLDVTVLNYTIMATKMPFVGRG